MPKQSTEKVTVNKSWKRRFCKLTKESVSDPSGNTDSGFTNFIMNPWQNWMSATFACA